MKIGVVADTHGFFDPNLKRALAGVECILHAGDVGSADVLDALRQIAPVHAVRGNVDYSLPALPLSLTLTVDRLQLQMMHILPVPQSELKAWAEGAVSPTKAPRRSEMFLRSFEETTGLVIFGHSHTPCLVKLGGCLFLNPGSAGRKRFSLPRSYAQLEISSEGAAATIQLLESYNGDVPANMWLDFETQGSR